MTENWKQIPAFLLSFHKHFRFDYLWLLIKFCQIVLFQTSSRKSKNTAKTTNFINTKLVAVKRKTAKRVHETGDERDFSVLYISVELLHTMLQNEMQASQWNKKHSRVGEWKKISSSSVVQGIFLHTWESCGSYVMMLDWWFNELISRFDGKL